MFSSPPFPNNATLQTACRACLRSLAGMSPFSSLDIDHAGAHWPDISADKELLQILRGILASAVELTFEDIGDEIYLERLASQLSVTWETATESQVLIATGTKSLLQAIHSWHYSDEPEKTKSLACLSIAASILACEEDNDLELNVNDDDRGSAYSKCGSLAAPLYIEAVGDDYVADEEQFSDSLLTFAAYETLNGLHSRGPAWKFWSDWYEGFVLGMPTDWHLQKAVLQAIEEHEWSAGAEVVAGRIDEIQTKWRLQQEIERLKEQLSLATSLSHAHRKHNKPPPLEGESGLALEAIPLIKEELGALEAEIAKPDAEPSALQKIAQRLWAIAEMVANYCGGKIDVILETAAKELGSTGTKWTIRSGAAYWISTQEGTQTVAKLAWQYAEKLLSGG